MRAQQNSITCKVNNNKRPCQEDILASPGCVFSLLWVLLFDISAWDIKYTHLGRFAARRDANENLLGCEGICRTKPIFGFSDILYIKCITECQTQGNRLVKWRFQQVGLMHSFNKFTTLDYFLAVHFTHTDASVSEWDGHFPVIILKNTFQLRLPYCNFYSPKAELA